MPFLKGAPFEPLGEASLDDLTRKAIFITVLASGRCRIEVYSFSGFPSAARYSDAQDWVTLVELTGFLAKNLALTGSSPLVKSPAMMSHEGTFDSDLY